jgi:hypothetical protein
VPAAQLTFPCTIFRRTVGEFRQNVLIKLFKSFLKNKTNYKLFLQGKLEWNSAGPLVK